MAEARKTKTPRIYKYHRVCRLEECTIEFDTNRKDHFFCDTVHQQEWWRRERAGATALSSEISRQAKEIESLKQRLDDLKEKND